jgi:hypothetical protein
LHFVGKTKSQENATRITHPLSYQSQWGKPSLEEVMILSSVFSSGDFQSNAAIALFLFLSVVMVSVFSFVSIAVWTEARRKEREAYYKSETMRRIAEAPGDGGRSVIEVMQEEERIRQAAARVKDVRTIEGMKIGGIVNIAVGVGLGVFLFSIGGRESPYLVGMIPGLIGVALLMYVYFFVPKRPVI